MSAGKGVEVSEDLECETGLENSNGYIEDFIEWQEKQFTPWHYISEGKVVPSISAEGNPKRLATALRPPFLTKTYW